MSLDLPKSRLQHALACTFRYQESGRPHHLADEIAGAKQKLLDTAVDTGTVGIGASDSGEYAYAPAKNHVKAGSTVTWTNNGSLEHTVTFQGGIGLDSGLLSTGQSAAFEFNTPGTYNYFCTPHPWMLGQVIVD